jgi:hypothetical protein
MIIMENQAVSQKSSELERERESWVDIHKDFDRENYQQI